MVKVVIGVMIESMIHVVIEIMVGVDLAVVGVMPAQSEKQQHRLQQ